MLDGQALFSVAQEAPDFPQNPPKYHGRKHQRNKENYQRPELRPMTKDIKHHEDSEADNNPCDYDLLHADLGRLLLGPPARANMCIGPGITAEQVSAPMNAHLCR